jgi:hypothetical protein
MLAGAAGPERMRGVMKPRCRILGVCLLVGLLPAAGCGGFYRVIDPHSGRQYYTRHVHRKLGGDVRFTDAKSGSRVTLESSEIRKIPEAEFQSAMTASQDQPSQEHVEKQ